MTEEQFDPANEDADLRVHLSRLPRHEAPPQLLSKLRREFIGPTWLDIVKEWFAWPTVWKPAGVMATAALLGMLWLSYQEKEKKNTIDLGPLLAAHGQTQSESLVPDSNMIAADLQLAAYYENN